MRTTKATPKKVSSTKAFENYALAVYQRGIRNGVSARKAIQSNADLAQKFVKGLLKKAEKEYQRGRDDERNAIYESRQKINASIRDSFFKIRDRDAQKLRDKVASIISVDEVKKGNVTFSISTPQLLSVMEAFLKEQGVLKS